MDNIVLCKKSPELELFCRELGFSETLFLDEVELITENNPKLLCKKIEQAYHKKKVVIYKATTEALLRLVLERTAAEIVLGVEQINPEDSVHYVRGGLDQVLCKIAAEKGKIIAFSFAEILQSKDRSKLIGRMRFNLRLCQKYNVKPFFGNFSTDKMGLRSKKDLQAWERILLKQKNKLVSSSRQ